MQAKYDQITMKNRSERLAGQTEISAKTNLAVENAGKILGISSSVSCVGTEVTEKKLAISGRATFSLCYEGADGAIRKTECGAEFSFAIEDDKIPAAGKAQVVLCVERAEADGDGAINAVISADATIITGVTAVYLSGGEGVVCRMEEVSLPRCVGTCKSAFSLDEEFELNYGVKEVLLHDTKVVVTGAQCGIGAVIVEGCCIFSMSLLQNIENSDILLERRIFPFRLEVECPEVMPNYAAFARGAEKSTKLEITVDEQTGKSVVVASVGMELECEAYDDALLSVATDAYLSDRECTLAKERYAYSYPSASKQFTERVTVRGALRSELPQGARLMSVGLAKLNPMVETSDGKVVAEGSIEGKAFLRDIDAKITAIPFEAPFVVALQYDLRDGERLTIDGGIEELSARIVSSEEIELTATLRLVLTGRKKCEFHAISSFTEGEPRPVNDAAISVYIPAKGEDLWTVAKRLNTCPDAILQYNSDLSFPLTGEERILIYRQIMKDY